MALVAEWLDIDANDPAALARFWAAALDYKLEPGDDPAEAAVIPKDGKGVQLLFLQVPEGKTIKNRLHLDLRPADQDAEVERLLGLGARRVDIGQGEQTWVVLADPEGNEFCVLRANE
jgi:predicted enzyme related to lactoylglutathione lyase